MNTLRCDLYKSIINIGFVGAVLITAVLCFTAPAYTDSKTETSYSVFETAFSFERSFIEQQPELTALAIFRKALSGYITMFIPIVAAFPFTVAFCTERSSGEMRFIIVRTGKLKYCFSKFVSAFAGGGMSVMLGAALFDISTVIMFPTAQEDGALSFVMKQLLTAFFYGAVSAMPAFFLSSFCKDPYIITCIPFMLAYIRDTAVNKIVQDAMENMDKETIDKIFPFSSSSMTMLSFSSDINERIIGVLAVNAVIAAALFGGFVLIMELRKDKGA